LKLFILNIALMLTFIKSSSNFIIYFLVSQFSCLLWELASIATNTRNKSSVCSGSSRIGRAKGKVKSSTILHRAKEQTWLREMRIFSFQLRRLVAFSLLTSARESLQLLFFSAGAWLVMQPSTTFPWMNPSGAEHVVRSSLTRAATCQDVLTTAAPPGSGAGKCKCDFPIFQSKVAFCLKRKTKVARKFVCEFCHRPSSDSSRLCSSWTVLDAMDEVEGSGDIGSVQKELESGPVLAHQAIEPTVVSALLVSTSLHVLSSFNHPNPFRIEVY
jgi:hypothetical protein